MQARTYLPAYGKFAQVDPAYDQMKDDPETWNLYNYVTNNPVTHTDPDGRVMDFSAESQKEADGSTTTVTQMEEVQKTGVVEIINTTPSSQANDATYKSKSSDVVSSLLKCDFKEAGKSLLQAWGLAAKDPEWLFTAALATAAPFLAAEGTAATGARSAGSEAASSVNGARLGMQLAAEESAGVRMPTSINSYSSHALDQIAGRDGGLGVKPTAVADAFRNPSSIQYKPSKWGPTFSFTGNNATVIVNHQGRVVTTWATNSDGVLRP